MAKTRRRTGYRKSKKWNPKSRKVSRASRSSKASRSRKTRRNCGRNPRYARPNEDKIETVRITRGSRRNCGRNPAVFRRHLSDGSEVAVTTDGHVRITDGGVLYDSYRIPTWRVGEMISSVKHARRGGREDFRSSNMHEEIPELQTNPKRRGKGRKAKAKKSRGRARRRNPAQFPMPFMSAMNPRRKAKSRAVRRNHPISRRDAASMKRVLRSHKYHCR